MMRTLYHLPRAAGKKEKSDSIWAEARELIVTISQFEDCGAVGSEWGKGGMYDM